MAGPPYIREIHSDPSSLDGYLPGQVDDRSEVLNAGFTPPQRTNIYDRSKAVSAVNVGFTYIYIRLKPQYSPRKLLLLYFIK